MEYTVETLRARFPLNEVIVDAHGYPSVMVYVPMFLMRDVIDGGSDMPHPAFVRNDEILHGIYISKFQNTLTDGYACAIPDKDPSTHIDYDTAVRACCEKGNGWHLMSAAEWGAIALWCRKNGWLPWGNNDWGKDYREVKSSARFSCEDREASICRTETGSGPFEWSHNHLADGIWDLNGNVWEWVGGLRLVCGEVQFCEEDSEAWFALNGKTGERIVPNGNGTTPDSVKLDYINGIWTYISAQVTDSLAKPRFCDFMDVKTDETLCPAVREKLIAWGLLPSHRGEDLNGVSLYANNGAVERMPFRGGRWGQGSNAGIFKTCLDDPRTYAGSAVGFRCAYYEV